MKFNLFLKWSALVVGLLLLTGCTAVAEQFTEVVGGMVANGSLTAEQGTAVIQAFDAAAQAQDWWQVPLNILGGAVLSWLGIRSRLPVIGRGAPTQKVGLPANKVQVAPTPA